MQEILTQKTFKEYTYISRYAVFPYFYNRVDKKYIYGITSHLKKDTGYVPYIVKQGDTPDTISLYFYNSPLYYAFILDFNNINDPYATLEPGTLLRIPTLSTVEYNL